MARLWEARSFVLPGSEPTGIQMDKIGLGIIAHATGAQSCGGFVELPGGQIGYPYINGPTFHMQAFLGDTA